MKTKTCYENTPAAERIRAENILIASCFIIVVSFEYSQHYTGKSINMPEELLDIVNDEDMVIDRQTRTLVHQLGLQHRGAHIFLFRQDRKMLVQKRSADRASSPSMLDCSVSEHVQAGESYLEAAIRGLREEMGVAGIELERLAKFRMNYGVNDNEISELYEGVVNPAHVKFDPVEIESIQYLRMDELKEMLANEREKLCGWFVELLNLYLYGSGKMQVME